jgi:hypothetical protein
MVSRDLNLIGQGTYRHGSGSARNLIDATWAPGVYLNNGRGTLEKHEQLAAVFLFPGCRDRSCSAEVAAWTVENGLLATR